MSGPILIPAPSARESVVAVDAIPTTKSAISSVVELIWVVVPSINKSPLILTEPVLSPTAAGSIVISSGPLIVLEVTLIAEPSSPVWKAVALTVPITSSFSDGTVVLIPTLPAEVIRSLSVPAVSTATVSSAGNLIAVLVSPVWTILSAIVTLLKVGSSVSVIVAAIPDAVAVRLLLTKLISPILPSDDPPSSLIITPLKAPTCEAVISVKLEPSPWKVPVIELEADTFVALKSVKVGSSVSVIVAPTPDAVAVKFPLTKLIFLTLSTVPTLESSSWMVIPIIAPFTWDAVSPVMSDPSPWKAVAVITPLVASAAIELPMLTSPRISKDLLESKIVVPIPTRPTTLREVSFSLLPINPNLNLSWLPEAYFAIAL